MIDLSHIGGWMGALGRFLRYCLWRFVRDDGLRAAAALSYSSLLALVPLVAITFAVLSGFDAFEGLHAKLQEQLLAAMLPEAAQTVGDYITGFVSNTRRMTGAGILGLTVTAILLLNTITGAFGAIWRAREQRPLAARVLVYWALLTLGPILLGASVSLSTYVFAAVEWAGIDIRAMSFLSLSRVLTFLLSTLGCALLFIVVPNRSVQPRHALAGALVAAFLFELLKRAFGLYLANFPIYQAIYGALAAIPIFLVWMYLSWAALLLGAEIAASLPEWRAAEARRAGAHGPGAKLALAVALLARLRQASRQGRVLKERSLARDLPATLGEFDEVLNALRRGGWVVRSGAGRWVLARDLATVSLDDLVRALGLSLEPGAGWPEGVAAAVGALARAAAEPGRRNLAEILDAPPAEAPPEAPLRAID